jgi:uncharacterized protein YkwD
MRDFTKKLLAGLTWSEGLTLSRRSRLILAAVVVFALGVDVAANSQPNPPARHVSVHQKHVYKPKLKPAEPAPEPTPAQSVTPRSKTYSTGPAAPVASGRPSVAANGFEAGVNAVRAAHGLRALSTHPALRQAAFNRANYMCSHHVFSHDGYEGQVLAVYSPPSPGYVGENISAGLYAGGDAQVVQELVNSPHHFENMLNPGWTEQGAASITCTDPAYCLAISICQVGQPVQINVNDFGG